MISKESEEYKELLEKIEERKALINNEVEFNKLSEEERVKTTEFLKLSERMAGVIENTKSVSNTKQEQVMWTSKLRTLIPNYVQEVNGAIFFDGEKGIFKTYNTFDIFGASSVNYPQADIIQPEDFLLPYISGVVFKINGELRQFDVDEYGQCTVECAGHTGAIKVTTTVNMSSDFTPIHEESEYRAEFSIYINLDTGIVSVDKFVYVFSNSTPQWIEPQWVGYVLSDSNEPLLRTPPLNGTRVVNKDKWYIKSSKQDTHVDGSNVYRVDITPKTIEISHDEKLSLLKLVECKSTELELQELRNNIATLRSVFNKQLELMEGYVGVLEKRLEKYRK